MTTPQQRAQNAARKRKAELERSRRLSQTSEQWELAHDSLCDTARAYGKAHTTDTDLDTYNDVLEALADAAVVYESACAAFESARGITRQEEWVDRP